MSEDLAWMTPEQRAALDRLSADLAASGLTWQRWVVRYGYSDPNPLPPRIHLFRFPRRELVLAVGAVAST